MKREQQNLVCSITLTMLSLFGLKLYLCCPSSEFTLVSLKDGKVSEGYTTQTYHSITGHNAGISFLLIK